jgi:hypothetical protein
MPVSPDIVVTKPDLPEIVLAVEIKLARVPPQVAAAQLKGYMARQSCPLGMLVTPDDTFFLRNPFTGYDAETILNAGECRTKDLLGAVPATEEELELRVEQWLESLPAQERRSWPASAQEAMEFLVIPAVTGAIVRAAGPRWRRSGS